MDHHHLASSLLSRPLFDVIAWNDPVCAHGTPSDTDEALVMLCPVLGPSATLVLHRLSRYAAAGPTSWEPSVFAATFGLSANAATGLAVKALTRLARFGFATIGSSTLSVRTHVPPLPQRWLAAMPDYLRVHPTAAAA
ncbi:MAG: hypothetical protein JWM34_3334 [Ilumatobacteraceae bacterium]|nr:hypothetical protein [Ilumatobacteraceae bacterium]